MGNRVYILSEDRLRYAHVSPLRSSTYEDEVHNVRDIFVNAGLGV